MANTPVRHVGWIYHAYAICLVFMLVQLASKRTSLDRASIGFGEIAERDAPPITHTPIFSRIPFTAMFNRR